MNVSGKLVVARQLIFVRPEYHVEATPPATATSASALARTADAVFPGLYSVDPIPNAVAPAAQYAGILGAVMPPTGISVTPFGSTARSDFTTGGAIQQVAHRIGPIVCIADDTRTMPQCGRNGCKLLAASRIASTCTDDTAHRGHLISLPIENSETGYIVCSALSGPPD